MMAQTAFAHMWAVRRLLIGLLRTLGARGFTYPADKFIDSQSKFNILVDQAQSSRLVARLDTQRRWHTHVA